MTALNSYSTGTVSVSDGDTVIVGDDTIWSGVNARAGDVIIVDGLAPVEIKDVTDVEHLTLWAPWSGGAKSGADYTIIQKSPLRFAGGQTAADVQTLVAAINTDGFYVFVSSDLSEPDPSLGNEDQFALQASTGKLWLKSGGEWVFQGVYKGFNIHGAYDSGVTYSVGDVVSFAGSSYVWINATSAAGHEPPDPTYWQVLAAKGEGATIAIGTVTTGAGGSDAEVTNSGTAVDAVLDFSIPAGKSYGGTSTTSLAIGAGNKAFATQAGLAYQNGARVRASSAANTSNWMEGVATYADTTLTINVDKINGSGTFASWNLNIAGQPGAGDLSSANALSELSGVAATARGNIEALGTGITKAIQQAATANDIGVTPGHQQDHPSACKAWVKFTGVGGATILASYNISNVVRASTGSYSIAFTVPFASSNYAIAYSVFFNTGGHAQFMRSSTIAASGCAILALDSTFNPADTDGMMLVFFGDQ
jgi:hypothetical protein